MATRSSELNKDTLLWMYEKMVTIRRFEEQCPEVPVYRVDVIRQRKLAGRIAEDLGVRHESPQVIVLIAGEPSWHASHRDVTTEGLAAAIAS